MNNYMKNFLNEDYNTTQRKGMSTSPAGTLQTQILLGAAAGWLSSFNGYVNPGGG